MPYDMIRIIESLGIRPRQGNKILNDSLPIRSRATDNNSSIIRK